MGVLPNLFCLTIRKPKKFMPNRIPWAMIAKHLAGECSEEERLYLESWLKEPGNYDLFKEIKESWKAQTSFWDTKEKYDVEKGLQRLNSKIREENKAGNADDHPRNETAVLAFPWRSIAASIALALTLIFTGNKYLNFNENNEKSQQFYSVRKSGDNEKIRITLPDGSQVWLNESSTIRYPEHFEKDKREVLLSGEAFFDVVPDKKRPFVVKTSKVTTRVLGTSFNVNAYQKEPQTKVTVETGRVAVSLAGDQKEQREVAQLTPQQELVVNNQNKETHINTISWAEIASWRQDRFIFRSNSYEEVCKVLEEKYAVRIEIKNEQLKQCKVMASFDKHAGLSEILQLLSVSNSFTFNQKKDHITIEGGVCK
jgi:transmembrane sensor